MTTPPAKRAQRAHTMERDARELPDDALERLGAEARHDVDELARRLEDARAWSDALDAEHDRRSVQRRAG